MHIVSCAHMHELYLCWSNKVIASHLLSAKKVSIHKVSIRKIIYSIAVKYVYMKHKEKFVLRRKFKSEFKSQSTVT